MYLSSVPLYKPGFNFTISDLHLPSLSTPTITPDQPFDIAGPRIWLDEEGFSVSVDQFQPLTSQVACPIYISGSVWVWRCSFPNHNSTSMLNQVYGQPMYWWDNQTEWRSFLFNRKDNPWLSLGTGGDTAVMKHVFTLTKGRVRHTFLQTVVKISMMSSSPPRLDEGEITELIRRAWSPDPNQPIDIATKALADFIISAETNGTSASLGTIRGSSDGSAVYTASMDLLHPSANTTELLGFTDIPLMSILRISTTNITHIRSETVDEPVQPLQPCHRFYENLAFGGKVTGTNCHKSIIIRNQTVGVRFLGQLDSSAITILTDIIGDGSQNTSAGAYSTIGWNWYSENQGFMDGLLLARGIAVGGDASSVTINVKTTVPAISHLQLLLVVLPLVLALMSLVTMLKDHGGYYSSSFLYAMSATTHLNTDSCTKVPFASAPPDIQLKYAGQHAVLQAGKGYTIGILSPGDISPLSAAPLNLNAKEV